MVLESLSIQNNEADNRERIGFLLKFLCGAIILLLLAAVLIFIYMYSQYQRDNQVTIVTKEKEETTLEVEPPSVRVALAYEE